MITTAFEPLTKRATKRAVSGPGKIIRKPPRPPSLTPGPIINIWVTDLAHNSLRLNWDPVPGATRYHIRWYGQERNPTGTSQGIPYLVANNNYNFYMTASNEHGESEVVIFSIRTPSA